MHPQPRTAGILKLKPKPNVSSQEVPKEPDPFFTQPPVNVGKLKQHMVPTLQSRSLYQPLPVDAVLVDGIRVVQLNDQRRPPLPVDPLARGVQKPPKPVDPHTAFRRPYNEAYDYVDKWRKMQALTDLFNAVDADGSGMVSREEFCTCMLNRECKKIFAGYGIQPHHGDSLFRYIDKTNSNDIPVAAFMAGLQEVLHMTENGDKELDVALLHPRGESKTKLEPAGRQPAPVPYSNPMEAKGQRHVTMQTLARRAMNEPSESFRNEMRRATVSEVARIQGLQKTHSAPQLRTRAPTLVFAGGNAIGKSTPNLKRTSMSFEVSQSRFDIPL